MPDSLGPIVVSACLGALIGLIRQWSEQVEAGENAPDFGGMRTHTLWALLGCVAAFASSDQTPLALPVVLAAVTVQLIVFRVPSPQGERAAGSTTLAGALLTVMVGALVAWDNIQSAALVAAIAMVILGSKQPIHAVLNRFTLQDIRATLQFVAITGVILPLVPDRDMGPFGGFNPYSTWLLVVLISGVGFAGYVAMRLLGAQAGLLLTSVLGGIASSTASTLAFSRRSKEVAALAEHCAFAVIVACTVMLPRVIVIVGVVNRELAWALVRPFLIMAVPAFGYGVWFAVRQRAAGPRRKKVESPKIGNPLSLYTAIKFGALYALIGFLVKAATQLDWQGSLLPLSFVSGLTDMDAIALSMAESRNANRVAPLLATQAVTLAAVANSVLKGGLAAALGSPVLRRHTAIVLGLTALAGLAAMRLVG